MNTTFLYAASFAGAVTTLAHIFVGGKQNAAPVLNAPDLEAGPKTTVTFAWHAASVFLFAVTVIYLVAATTGISKSLVVATTMHCGALTLLSAITALRGGVKVTAFPPTILFAAISILGTIALWA